MLLWRLVASVARWIAAWIRRWWVRPPPLPSEEKAIISEDVEAPASLARCSSSSEADEDKVEEMGSSSKNLGGQSSSDETMARSLSLFGLWSSEAKEAHNLLCVATRHDDKAVQKLERCLELARPRRVLLEECLGCDVGVLRSVAGCGRRFARQAGRALRSASCARLRRALAHAYAGRARKVLESAVERYVLTGRPYELAASVLLADKKVSRAAIQALVFAHPSTRIARYCLVEAYYAAVAAAVRASAQRTSSSRTSPRDLAMTSWLAVAGDDERPLDERCLAVATIVDAYEFCLEQRPERRFLQDALDELQRLVDAADVFLSDDAPQTDPFCHGPLAAKMGALCRSRVFLRLGTLVAALAARRRDDPRADDAASAEVQALALSIVQDVRLLLEREYDAAVDESYVLGNQDVLVQIYQLRVVGGDARAGLADIVRVVSSDLPRFSALFLVLVDRLATKRIDGLRKVSSAGNLSIVRDDGYMLRTYVALLFVCELCLSSSPRAILRHLKSDDEGHFVSKFLVGYRSVLEVVPSLFVKSDKFAHSRLVDESADVSVNPYKPAAPQENQSNRRTPPAAAPAPASAQLTHPNELAFRANDLARFSTHAFALRTHPSAANLLTALPS